jgi:hypothetical protein
MATRGMGLTFTVRSTLSSFWRGFRDAFSNIHVDIHDTIEQDGKGRSPLDNGYDSRRSFSRNSTRQQARHGKRY